LYVQNILEQKKSHKARKDFVSKVVIIMFPCVWRARCKCSDQYVVWCQWSNVRCYRSISVWYSGGSWKSM